MPGKLITVIFCCVLINNIHAQQPEKLLNLWAERSPIEKIYLHFDRGDYMAGQTAWFKGYLYADFLPADKSTTVFTELFNESGRLINRQALPVFLGFTRGQIELPDTLSEGRYTVRAYTTAMLNHAPEFLYKKVLFVTGKNKTVNKKTGTAGIRMEFFPEGGNFITGLSNSIAFKATNEQGLPVAVSGVIKKENGEKVADFTSIHDGMGYADVTAEESTAYYAVLNNDASGQKYYLPAQTTKGVVLRIINSGKIKTYEILQRPGDPVFKAAYMVGQIQHHVVFRKEFKDARDEMTGAIQVGNLSSGIMHITVFNKDNIPLAERLTFVDNREYILPAEMREDTVNFSPRSSNQFTLSLKDTVKGSFSVSVSDADFDVSPARSENIFSGLLLTSDLNGYVHNPAYYFSSASDSVQNALDLVMMTNGWRRFKWNDLLKGPAASQYKDPGYITLNGKIVLAGTKKPFAGKELLVLIVMADSSKNVQMIRTDAEGRFHHDSIIFFDRAKILFSDIKGKRSKFIEVKMDGDSLHRSYALPEIKLYDQSLQNGTFDLVADRIKEDYDAIIKAQGRMLQGVTVRGRKKTPIQELEEKYTSGLFGGDSRQTIDLVNQKDETTGYATIFDYLAYRVTGLTVSFEMGKYSIFYRQADNTLSSLGRMPMALFLDEVEQTDADAIAAIPPDQVAMVKVFSSFVGAAGAGPGGALAIYLKKGSDYLSSLPSAGEVINYNGYSVIKEFYSPDYKVENNNSQSDHRITLHWNPLIFVNTVDPQIPIRFYNNDRTRRYKIVAEGMTNDGKMLMIEKTITDKKAF